MRLAGAVGALICTMAFAGFSQAHGLNVHLDPFFKRGVGFDGVHKIGFVGTLGEIGAIKSASYKKDLFWTSIAKISEICGSKGIFGFDFAGEYRNARANSALDVKLLSLETEQIAIRPNYSVHAAFVAVCNYCHFYIGIGCSPVPVVFHADPNTDKGVRWLGVSIRFDILRNRDIHFQQWSLGGLYSFPESFIAILHSAPLQENYAHVYPGYYGENNGEYSDPPRPSRHHPLIFLVIGLALLGLGSILMVLAFKSAEKADDYGFTWWWAPLIGFTLLALLLLGQGIKFLGRYDDVREIEIHLYKLGQFGSSGLPKYGG